MKSRIAEKIEELKKIHPWYGEFIGNISEFADLPYVTRDVLDKYYYNHCYDKTLIKFTTSGTSTGVKRAIYYSQDEIDYNNNQKKKLFGNFIGGLNPVGIVVGIGLAASSADRVFKSLNKETFIISYDDSFDKVIQLMPEYQPEVLYSMPSLIDSIIEQMDPELLISVKKVILVGEILTDDARKKISRGLNIHENDILNTYGCVELGLLAFECKVCNRFHFVKNIYPEVIEKQTKKNDKEKDEYFLSENSSGILAVTSFCRKNIPALKYVTYDYIEDLEKTVCNKEEIYTFKRILGRVGNEFKHGERLSLYDLETALLRVIPDANFKIVIQENCVKIVLKNKKEYNPELLEKAEASVNKANTAIWHMINNHFLKRIKIEVDQKDSANVNWKKRVEYNYVKTRQKALIFLDLPRNMDNYLDEIKKLDLRTIILLPLKSKNAEIKNDKRVDRHYKINFMDFNEVLTFIKKNILREYEVIRIITHNEYNIALCGFLEEKLVPNPILDSKTAMFCRDKYAMRDKLKQIGCYTPDYAIINSVEDAINFYSERRKSIVLKPRFGTASLGVVKIDNVSQIYQHFKLIKMTTLTYQLVQKDSILAEEYFEGKEYGIESLMHNGKLQLFVVSEKPNSFKPPFFEESIYFSHPDFNEQEFKELLTLVERINIEFGIVTGPSHLELRINNGKIFVIEIAARNGSSFKYLSRILREPFEAVQLKNLLGIDQKQYLVNGDSKYVAYYLMQSPGKGKLIKIDGLEEAKEIEEVFSIDIFKKEGDQIVPFPYFNGYIGTIYAEGESRAKTLNSIIQAHDSIKIVVR